MTKEQEEILIAFRRMQQAMIDKDAAVMTSLVMPDKTFRHMSGKVQTKEEFFGEIMDGTLNYYRYRIGTPVIEVHGDRALFIADVTLTARVYGISGSWTLHNRTPYVRVDGKWLQSND